MATLLNFPANSLIGDNNAQLVAGDVAALHANKVGRPVLAFDDTEEMAALTPEVEMPSQYTGSGLKGVVHGFMASDNSNDIALDMFVEAKTPNSDTLDMETASSWDSANSGTISLSGTTAGDPFTVEITLTNADGVQPGDLVRFGIRRDCDSGDDDASGDLYITCIEIEDDG